MKTKTDLQILFHRRLLEIPRGTPVLNPVRNKPKNIYILAVEPEFLISLGATPHDAVRYPCYVPESEIDFEGGIPHQ